MVVPRIATRMLRNALFNRIEGINVCLATAPQSGWTRNGMTRYNNNPIHSHFSKPAIR